MLANAMENDGVQWRKSHLRIVRVRVVVPSGEETDRPEESKKEREGEIISETEYDASIASVLISVKMHVRSFTYTGHVTHAEHQQ